MPSPLSVDLRQRVVAFVSQGASCREAAARFGVSAASASRWAARRRQDGHVAPRPMGGDRHSHHMEAHARLILATCRKQPTIFLRELRDQLVRRGVRASISSVSRLLARHGVSRKQGRRMPPSRPART